jgi:hypothetical protein
VIIYRVYKQSMNTPLSCERWELATSRTFKEADDAECFIRNDRVMHKDCFAKFRTLSDAIEFSDSDTAVGYRYLIVGKS